MNPNYRGNITFNQIIGKLAEKMFGSTDDPTAIGGFIQGAAESPGFFMDSIESMRDMGLRRDLPHYGPNLMDIGGQLTGYQVPESGPAAVGRAMGRNLGSVGAGIGEYVRQQGGGGLAQTVGEVLGDVSTGNPRALAAIPIIMQRGSKRAAKKLATEVASELGEETDSGMFGIPERRVQASPPDDDFPDMMHSSMSPEDLENYFVRSYKNGSVGGGGFNASNTPHYSEIFDDVDPPDFDIVEMEGDQGAREWFIEDLRSRPDGYDEQGYLVYDDNDNVVGWSPTKKGARNIIKRVAK